MNYDNTNKWECKACLTRCGECTMKDQCTTCSAPLNSGPFKTETDNKPSAADQCPSCDANCAEAEIKQDDPNKGTCVCKKCKNSYYLDGNTCK